MNNIYPKTFRDLIKPIDKEIKVIIFLAFIGTISLLISPIAITIAVQKYFHDNICTGIVFMHSNIVLMFLPFVYWLFMTILMKCTEEKWLLKLYGQEYIAYCKRVNRCIPWVRRVRIY